MARKSSTALLLLLLLLAGLAEPAPASELPLPPDDGDGGGQNPFLAFIDALRSFGEFLWNGVLTIGRVLGAVVEGFKLIGSGLAAVPSLFGQAGDPGRYMLVAGRGLSDSTARLALSNCSAVRLDQLSHIVPEWKGKTDAFCTAVPTGIIGYMSMAVFAASAALPIIQAIGRWFLFLWFGSALLAVVVGMERATKHGDWNYAVEGLQLAWRILTFPFKVIWKLVEFIVKFIEALSQFLDVILGPLT
jgi:hypothetical protein